MPFKFEIKDTHFLTITDTTVVGDAIEQMVLDMPRADVYYDHRQLRFDRGEVYLYDKNDTSTDGAKMFLKKLEDCQDENGVNFTRSTFVEWMRLNTGFDATGSTGPSGNDGAPIVDLATNDLGRSAWGVPKFVLDKSIIHGMFSFNVPVSTWREKYNGVEVSFLNATSINGALNLTSGATLDDVTNLQTFRNPRYQPNRGHIYSTAGFLPTPAALGNRRFGIATAENGVFFSLESGVLYGVIRTTKGGATTEDKVLINTTGIDLSKGNTFDIQFQWRGVGNYFFYVNLQKDGSFDYLGTLSDLSMANPALPPFYECENKGDEVEMQIGCFDVSSEGGDDNGKTYGSVSVDNDSGQIAISGFNVPIIAIKSLDLVDGKINTRDIIALLASGYSDQRSLLRVWTTRDFSAITENDQTWRDYGDGHLQYLVYDFPDEGAAMTFDTSKAELMFGSRVDQDQTYSTSALFEGRTEIYQTPGDMFIFTMHRETGGGCNVGVTYEFAEEI